MTVSEVIDRLRTQTPDAFDAALETLEQLTPTEEEWEMLEEAVRAWPPDVERRVPVPWMDDHMLPKQSHASWRLCNTLRLSGALGPDIVPFIKGASALLAGISKIYFANNVLPDVVKGGLLDALQDAPIEVAAIHGGFRLECARALGRWTDLRQLTISRTQLDDAALRLLLSAPWAPSLEKLAAWKCGWTSSSIEVLLAAPLPKLSTLRLEDDIGVAGVLAISRSTHLSALQTLRLFHCGIDDGVAEELAASPGLARLQVLDLRHNPITSIGKEALLRSPGLQNVSVTT